MSLLLCCECFAWVEPVRDRCPDCQQSLDSSTPDPPLSRLERVIGELISPLGEVRIDRKLLPDQGLLYRTSNGLYFLPHRVERETQLVPTCDAETSLLWSLAALAWSPLALVAPFLKRKTQLVEKQVRVFRPHELECTQSDLLPTFLMQNPGVFFVPRESILAVERRRHCWRIVRVHGVALKITPLDGIPAFEEQMDDLVAMR
jgi:hypothetical protein